MNNEGPWNDVIKLKTTKSDTIIDFTDAIFLHLANNNSEAKFKYLLIGNKLF